MFIKLTKSDGSPVWMNPEFIVRVEPWKSGSAVAVAGDGDFEVRETPQAIMSLVNAPAAPTPKPPEVPKPKQAKEAKPEQEPEAETEPEQATPGETPKRKPHSRRKKAEAEQPAEDGEQPAPAAETAVREDARPPEAEDVHALFPDMPDEVSEAAAKLKKNRCRSRKRILNMLKSLNPKISMEVARAMLDQMEARGFVSIDAQGHAVFA